MEVKMQYVVDLEDIPSEVSDLLPGHGVLASILNRLRDNLAEKNVEHAILDFQEAKREIYLLNRRILDRRSRICEYCSQQRYGASKL